MTFEEVVETAAVAENNSTRGKALTFRTESNRLESSLCLPVLSIASAGIPLCLALQVIEDVLETHSDLGFRPQKWLVLDPGSVEHYCSVT
jgi:hypothetical protein